MNYRIAYTESKRGRWKSEYRTEFADAWAFAQSKYQALIYNEIGTLVGNLTAKATTGYASYVQGLRAR